MTKQIYKLPNTEKIQNEVAPSIPYPHYISEAAHIIGDVQIGKEVSIFPGVVARGDIESIIIGNHSNIQEHSILHTTWGKGPCVIGDYVTVGHRAILHGTKVNNFVIIGMGSILLDDSEIGEYSIIGAGSVITMGKKFPSNSLILGSPAKAIRELNEEERKSIEFSAKKYIESGLRMKKSIKV